MRAEFGGIASPCPWLHRLWFLPAQFADGRRGIGYALKAHDARGIPRIAANRAAGQDDDVVKGRYGCATGEADPHRQGKRRAGPPMFQYFVHFNRQRLMVSVFVRREGRVQSAEMPALVMNFFQRSRSLLMMTFSRAGFMCHVQVPISPSSA